MGLVADAERQLRSIRSGVSYQRPDLGLSDLGVAANQADRDRVSAAECLLSGLPARRHGGFALRPAAWSLCPHLSALIGLLHGGYHLSMRTTAALLEDVRGVSISLGGVAASCARISAVLAPIDAAIQNHVQQQPQLWVDETSWREGTQRGWLWLAASPQATCFRIHASRGQGALWHLLGEQFAGVVHSDRASVHHALPDRQRQVCWAHIIRNLQGLVDHQNALAVATNK